MPRTNSTAKTTKKSLASLVPALPDSLPVPVKRPRARVARHDAAAAAVAAYIIHRLPNFGEDHRSDSRAVSEFMGEISGGSDLIPELRARFGADFFRVTERGSDGKIIKSWVVQTDDAPEAEIETEENESQFEGNFSDDLPESFRLRLENERLKARLETSRNGSSSSMLEMVQALKALDDLRGETQQQKSLIDQLKELRTAQELLAPRPSNPAPAVIVQPDEGDDEVKALVRLLRADPLRLDALRERLLTPPDESDSGMWGKLFTQIAPALGDSLPLLAQGFYSWATRRNEPQGAGTQQPAAPHSNFAPPAQPHNQQTPPVEVPAPIAALLDAIRTNANVQEVAQAIRAAMQQQPALVPMIDQWLRQEPHSVLIQLSQLGPEAAQVCALPHSAGWLGDLFDALEAMNDEADPQEQAGTEGQGIPMTGAAAKN